MPSAANLQSQANQVQRPCFLRLLCPMQVHPKRTINHPEAAQSAQLHMYSDEIQHSCIPQFTDDHAVEWPVHAKSGPSSSCPPNKVDKEDILLTLFQVPASTCSSLSTTTTIFSPGLKLSCPEKARGQLLRRATGKVQTTDEGFRLDRSQRASLEHLCMRSYGQVVKRSIPRHVALRCIDLCKA